MNEINKDTEIYLLTVEDLQTVAQEELGRELSPDEIKKVTEVVEKTIDWYNLIAEAINEVLNADNDAEDV